STSRRSRDSTRQGGGLRAMRETRNRGFELREALGSGLPGGEIIMAAKKTKISRMDRLYLDEGGFDFISRSKTWYSITVGLLVVAIADIAIRGFTLSLDFEGGTIVSLTAADLNEQAVSKVFQELTGEEPEQVQIVGSGDSATLEVNSERLSEEQADAARLAIYEEFEPVNPSGEATPDAVGVSTVSESWGSTITQRMVIAMIVFLVIATA